jgi:hypothetical protein
MIKYIILILLLTTPALANNTTCDVSLDLEIEKAIYNNQEQIIYFNKLSNEDHEFTIEYSIEDIFGNIIKKPTNTSNTNEKHYTPRITTSVKNLLIKNKLTYLDCNNTNNQLENQALIAILNPLPETPELTFTTNKEEYEFGETIKIDLQAYTGNASDKQIIINLQDIEESKIKLYKAYRNQSIQIPFSIPNNCKNKLNESNYEIKISGFELTTTKTIKITNQTTCPILTETIYVNQTTEPQKTTYEIPKPESNIKPQKDQITTAAVYKSSSEKSTDYIKYGIIGALVIIVIILIKKYGIHNKNNNRSGGETSRPRYQSSKQYKGPYKQRPRPGSYKPTYRRTSKNERVLGRVHRIRTEGRESS